MVKKEKYSDKVDIWAIGVLAFTLLFGAPPFDPEEDEDEEDEIDEEERKAMEKEKEVEKAARKGAVQPTNFSQSFSGVTSTTS